MSKAPERGQVVMVKQSWPWGTQQLRGRVDGLVSGVGFSLDTGGVFLFDKEGIDWDFVKPKLENK